MQSLAIVATKPNGEQISLTLSVERVNDVYSAPELKGCQIISIKKRAFGSFLSKDLFAKKIPLTDQSGYLYAISSMLNSGKTIANAFNLTMGMSNKGKNSHSFDFGNCESLEDHLQKAGFDKDIILIAASGDKTGNHDQSLRDAADYSLLKNKSSSELKKALVPTVILFVVAMCVMIFFPLFIYEPISELLFAEDALVEPNFFSNLIRTLYEIYTSYWMFIVGVFFILFLFREKIFNSSQSIFIFSKIHSLLMYYRSIGFLSIYRQLIRAGFKNIDVMSYLLKNSSGYTNKQYSEIYESVKLGNLISTSMNDDWPVILKVSLQGAEEKTNEQVYEILKPTLDSLLINQSNASQSLAREVNTLVFFIVGLVLCMVVFGVLLPLQSINVES